MDNWISILFFIKGACKEARRYALKSRHLSKFIPKCKADGSYAPIQCIEGTGCWCSDKTGKPIEKTSVRVGKPKCRSFNNNKTNIRRSPVRSGGRPCTDNDRTSFNAHLISVFQKEYLRSVKYQQPNGNMSGLVGMTDENVVLDWKFSQLDTNGNKMLDKQEFRDLKKMIKRVTIFFAILYLNKQTINSGHIGGQAQTLWTCLW